jgi:tetratricopeptide (TPR) repeat protein
MEFTLEIFISYPYHSLDSLGKYVEAIKYFDKALAIDPINTAALLKKGNSLDSLGKYEEARKYFDKALAIDPDYVLALNNKGNSLKNLHRYEQAITV